MNLLKHIKTVSKDPMILAEYLSWRLQKLQGKDPVRKLPCNVALSKFSNFSEFHSSREFVNSSEIKVLKSLAVPDKPILFDVGANLGTFSFTFGDLYPESEIYSFEPSPTTHDALLNNVEINNREFSITVINKIVGHEVGQQSFACDEKDRGRARISLTNDDSIMIDSITIDGFCKEKQIGVIDLLKVDVEGFESLVFKGAEEKLKRHEISYVYFEVCPSQTETANFKIEETCKLLEDCGYNLFRINSDGELAQVDSSMANDVVLENWIGIPDE